MALRIPKKIPDLKNVVADLETMGFMVIPRPQPSQERQFLCSDSSGTLIWIPASEIGYVPPQPPPSQVLDGGGFTEITDGQPALDGGGFQDTSTSTADGGDFF